jgi:protein involved in polysaccharide export with SLBB domain
VSIASKDFTIIGRVRKPGSFTLDRPTSILEAIARAEGIENGNLRGSAFELADFELADFERSFVARDGRKLDVDLARLYYEGDLSQNAFLEPDDYIYIASSLKNEIYVLGAVASPGRRKMPVKLTIAQAIAEAGGFDKYAYKMKVLLIRGSIHQAEAALANLPQEPQFQQLEFDRSVDPSLLQAPSGPYRVGPGDVLDIEVAENEGTRQQVKILPDGMLHYDVANGIHVKG